MNDTHMTMIEDCCKRDERLTAWEADFLDSIRDRMIDGRRLTDKQEETLNEIWERVTERG